MPNTGASQTIVSAAVARDAKLLIRSTRTDLRNASESVMDLMGEADAVLCNEKHSASSTVLVARHINHSALISWMDLQKLCVIPKTFPAVVGVLYPAKHEFLVMLREKSRALFFADMALTLTLSTSDSGGDGGSAGHGTG